MIAGSLPIYLLFITSIILVVMLGYVVSFREKNTLHFLFIASIAALLVWHISVIIAGFFHDDPVRYVFVDNFTYIGIAIIPICLLFVGMAYNKDFKGFDKRFFLFLIVPITTIVMVFTNQYHHLFYLSYSAEGGYVVGPYFYIHTFYSYVCMLVGMLMLSYYAVKTSGILSIQAILTVVGSLIPAVVNVCYTLNVPGFTIYSTPVAFTITVLSYLISIFRFGLLKVVPIAMQTVINQISDCFVVVDEQLYILDFNRAFKERFINCAPTKQSDKLDQLLDALALPFDQQESICTNVLETIRLKQTHKEELCIVFEEEFYYSVEYTLVSG
ncbi:MAG: hypothetical protein HGA54_10100, partial [Actinobacteria bacterium]|nr:hypothetical protein [Actinomycetota bacterium]